MKITFASYSDIGLRERNEDAAFVQETASGALAIVCDGLGGCLNGELASGTAVKVISSYLLGAAFDPETAEDAVIEANDAVCAIQPGKDSPKTTVALLWVDQEDALAIHVGDTRIYQFRNGEIVFQSIDHSIPNLDVMAGKTQESQIRSHQNRNRITRCLGSDEPVSMSRKRLHVVPGDRFLLCSDGFWEPVLEQDMLRELAASDTPSKWLSAMHELAREKENDNHTAVVLAVD